MVKEVQYMYIYLMFIDLPKVLDRNTRQLSEIKLPISVILACICNYFFGEVERELFDVL